MPLFPDALHDDVHVLLLDLADVATGERAVSTGRGAAHELRLLFEGVTGISVSGSCKRVDTTPARRTAYLTRSTLGGSPRFASSQQCGLQGAQAPPLNGGRRRPLFPLRSSGDLRGIPERSKSTSQYWANSAFPAPNDTASRTE